VVEYRAYTVGSDGHFAGFEPLVCANDSEAIEKASRLAVDDEVELWCGPRLVIRINPKAR
jgi:6-phosphogluconolactonase/glucosamine-6-phosphate isomerase/deaminase